MPVTTTHPTPTTREPGSLALASSDRARGPRTAFVLSGGASLGALQVGMLHALYERGITPDLLVGASAGALKAVLAATAIPGVLPPVRWGRRLLVDGAIVNGTPVSHAVERGAHCRVSCARSRAVRPQKALNR